MEYLLAESMASFEWRPTHRSASNNPATSLHIFCPYFWFNFRRQKIFQIILRSISTSTSDYLDYHGGRLFFRRSPRVQKKIFLVSSRVSNDLWHCPVKLKECLSLFQWRLITYHTSLLPSVVINFLAISSTPVLSFCTGLIYYLYAYFFTILRCCFVLCCF